MMKLRKFSSAVYGIVVVGIAAIFTLPGFAADRSETIHFSAGATSASLSGSIQGYDGINYRLGASSGQSMSILFNPDNPSCYFNVLPPGSQTAIFNGSVTGNEFASQLPASGDYTVQVYMMRNAARRDETCKYDITFEIAGNGQQSSLSNLGSDSTADSDDVAADSIDDDSVDNPVHFSARDARRACQRRLGEQYGVRRSAFSGVSVRRAGSEHFWVKGEVVRHRSQPDGFTCRVVHGEVVAMRVHPANRPAAAAGKGVLGTTLLGTPQAVGKSDFENAPHPAHARGNPFRDRQHLNKACRHEIARQLRHSHSRFDRLRFVTGHLRNRTLQGDGTIRWSDSDHIIHFTCHFDRRGRVVDGQFYYYPAQPAAYTPDYADGNAGGPDNWRVVDVAANDVLYVHARGSLASRRIGRLPHNARGVRNYGCRWSNIDKGTWCEIEYRGLRGYAAQMYLAEDS